MEGWGTAGKGSLIGELITNIDPRFFKVASMTEVQKEEFDDESPEGEGPEETEDTEVSEEQSSEETSTEE